MIISVNYRPARAAELQGGGGARELAHRFKAGVLLKGLGLSPSTHVKAHNLSISLVQDLLWHLQTLGTHREYNIYTQNTNPTNLK